MTGARNHQNVKLNEERKNRFNDTADFLVIKERTQKKKSIYFKFYDTRTRPPNRVAGLVTKGFFGLTGPKKGLMKNNGIKNGLTYSQKG